MNEHEAAVDARTMAEILGVKSVDTIYRKAKLGDIPSFKLGRLIRFRPSEVQKALSEPTDPWAYSPQSRAARRRAS